MMQEPLVCALVYDFDGTLAKGNCAEHGLLKALGIDNPQDFWRECKDARIRENADEILMYLGLLAAKASAQNSDALNGEKLREFGKGIPLFAGVESWFKRMNNHAEELGITLEHYVISSGLEEMIRGSRIGNEFTRVFGCRFVRLGEGEGPYWPAQAINYTTKTQYLFRINKGIDNTWDDDKINRFVEPELRHIPFGRMIFLGDGDTDIPSMKLVKSQGGHSLAVYDTEKWKSPDTQRKVEKLIAEERATYVAPADYREGSHLDITVKGLLQLIKRRAAV